MSGAGRLQLPHQKRCATPKLKSALVQTYAGIESNHTLQMAAALSYYSLYCPQRGPLFGHDCLYRFLRQHCCRHGFNAMELGTG